MLDFHYQYSNTQSNMASEDRFKQAIVATLAKRAANRCSNPDCGAITSGPSNDPQRSVNVGEAAHIFGAHPGAARYDPDMISADRAEISNAIWLCATCHKIVDDDPGKYPPGILFEWQRAHESNVAALVGKAGAEIRKRYEARHLEEFGRLSYLAERIILEKDPLWEYRLTAEVLRFEMAPVVRRWNALKRRLYLKRTSRIGFDDSLAWIASRIDEVQAIATAFGELVNVEFARAWGEPGIAGNEADIISTCRLFSEMCQSALDWEECVRFVAVNDVFSEVQSLFVGAAGSIIDESAKLPEFFSRLFSQDPNGYHELKLTIKLPDGWAEDVDVAMKRATEGAIAHHLRV